MFVTAYDIADEGFGGERIAFLCTVVIFFGFLLFFSSGWYRRHLARVRPNLPPPNRIALFGGFLIAAFATIGAIMVSVERIMLLRARAADDFATTEGDVRDYKTRQARGREVGDSFTVSGIEFKVEHSFVGGLSQPGCRGGPITPGKRVRLGHRDGAILRVEVFE